MSPIQDTTSGIANLNAKLRQQQQRWNTVKVFAAGMVAGAAIVALMFAIYLTKH